MASLFLFTTLSHHIQPPEEICNLFRCRRSPSLTKFKSNTQQRLILHFPAPRSNGHRRESNHEFTPVESEGRQVPWQPSLRYSCKHFPYSLTLQHRIHSTCPLDQQEEGTQCNYLQKSLGISSHVVTSLCNTLPNCKCPTQQSLCCRF